MTTVMTGSTMIPAIEHADSYAADMARFEGDALIELRRRALASFQSLGFPTRRNENWKYTNVRSVAQTDWRLAEGCAAVDPARVQPFLLSKTQCHQLVFVNGRLDTGLSRVGDLSAGVTLKPIADAADSDLLRKHLGSIAALEDDAFTALNTAFTQDGLFLHVPASVVIEHPIHVVYVSTDEGDDVVRVHPRTLVVAEACARATVIETYAGLGEREALVNPVTEIIAAESANVDHYKINRESERTNLIGSIHVQQNGPSAVTSHSYAFGGKLVRNDVRAYLNAEGCDSTFNGLTVTHGDQHVDNHLWIDHLKPHCNSWEFYKNVLDDSSRTVFAGRIYVAQDAQKTDAKQTNMNLLLSDDAHADTKPQLEIYADDVKCTHGATIGQMNESQLFYLQARGISRTAARSILIFAFANETIDEVKVEELRGQLEQLLLERLPESRSLVSGG